MFTCKPFPGIQQVGAQHEKWHAKNEKARHYFYFFMCCATSQLTESLEKAMFISFFHQVL